MPHVWIENGPASRRTLVLCLMLGLSVAAHRAVVGFRPELASAGDVIASGAEQDAGHAGLQMPPRQASEPTKAPDGAGSTKEGNAPDASPAKAAPRENPYARRLWVLDPFRSPNVLRLGAAKEPATAAPHPLLDGPATKELLARSSVEREPLADGTTRVCINMPAAAKSTEQERPAPRAEAAPQAPSQLARQIASKSARRSAPPRPSAITIRTLAPSIFAFAGHDLSREEGRRWTLALAFEGRGD